VVAVVEAPGGYGKSVLAQQLARHREAVIVHVGARYGAGSAAQFVTELRRGLRRAGLSDAAAVLDGSMPGDDAVGAVLERLEPLGSPVVITVDDAHALDGDARALVVLAADLMNPPHSLIVLARPMTPLRIRSPAVWIDADDLALDDHEVTELGTAFDIALDPHQAASLRRATGGWAAALTLTLAQVARAPEPDVALRRIGSAPAMVARLVDACLGQLDAADGDAAIQLAHLPVLSHEVAGAATGDGAILERLAGAGLPLNTVGEALWRFAGPVAEHLMSLGALRVDAAQRVAHAYVAMHTPAMALSTLLHADGANEAAGLIEHLPPAELERLEAEELQEVIDALSPSELDAHGFALMRLIRRYVAGPVYGPGARALARADEIARRTGDPALAHAVAAETANGLHVQGRVLEAAALAEQTLEVTGSDEPVTRLHLQKTLGSCIAEDPSIGGADAGAELLQQVIVEARRLDESDWAVRAASRLAFHVYYSTGRYDDAVRCLSEAIDLQSGRARHHAVYLTLIAEFQVECGRYDDALATLDQARQIGARLGERLVMAYDAWTRARMASQQQHAEETISLVREVELHRGDWFSEHSTGVEFLADAAALLDRVGAHAAAAEYLGRAVERRTEAPVEVAIAEAAIAARSGEPTHATDLLAAVSAMPMLKAKDRWRITLFQAYAALRAGDAGAGALAARAFKSAAALGYPHLPFVLERAIADQLVALAVEAGGPEAALASENLPVAVRVLGGFEVRHGGRIVTPPPGRNADALKIIASARSRVAVDELIEHLWPDADEESGRVRLRNVLARIGAACGTIVVRDGDGLRMAAGVTVDAVVFEEDVARARRAASGGDQSTALAVARVALARYRGDLLPDERYEAWAATRREALRRQRLALLDLCASAAERAGDLDEAVRLLREGIDVDPTDEDRYLHAAEILVRQGSRGAARRLLADLDVVLEDLGVRASIRQREVERSLQA
jgi:DNA-binding SARP family transcriptional activator